MIELAPWMAGAPALSHALTHGTLGLGLAYAAVQVPMAAALLQRRAGLRTLLLSPLAAAPLTAVSAASMAAVAPFLQFAGAAGQGLSQLALGVALSTGLGYAGGRRLAHAGEPASLHRRGSIVADASGTARARALQRDVDRSAKHAARPGRHGEALTLAGVQIPFQDETKHFKLIGTTGTGKSTAIRELLGGALRRGDRAVIADPDGGYLRRYYDPTRGDVVLNPFDARSRRWDLFGEIETQYDVDQLARALIPDHEGADRSWRGYARTFLGAVIEQLRVCGAADTRELYRLLVTAQTEELRLLVAGTPAQPFLEPHNSRMFDSVRSVTSSAVGALRYVAGQQAPSFSVRKWIAGQAQALDGEPRGHEEPRGREAPQGERGVLFIPYRAGQIAALRSTISAWMRLAIFEAMNQDERDQRLWFVVDELDALGQIDGLKDALARLRKFGGRCVLGWQSIAQVSSTYGSGEAQTIVENCGNTLVLRCSASEHGGTAQFASRLIGQREVVRSTISRTRRATDWLGSTTRAEHPGIEPAVMDSQIEQLADLHGYLKLASRPQWLTVVLAPAREERHTGPAASHGPQNRESRGHAAASRTLETAGALAQARQKWRAWRGRGDVSPTIAVGSIGARTGSIVPGERATERAMRAPVRAPVHASDVPNAARAGEREHLDEHAM